VVATLKDFFKPVPANNNGGLQQTAMSYGIMVIDMGVHELGGLEESLNLIQVTPGDEGGTLGHSHCNGRPQHVKN
jgi:hypothetical protein